jgi:homoserine kinase
MALQLYNSVEMAVTDSGLLIDVQGEGAGEIPKDESNIAYLAACRVFKHVGYKYGGLKIKLNNNIPVSRGLGSSTAAVVGGIIAANIISERQLTRREILNMACAMEGHPDNVAAAVLGGIAVAAPVDGEIKHVKIELPKKIKAVVAIPEFNLPTKVSREALPQQVSFNDAAFNLARLALLVAALGQGDMTLLGVAMEDRLHQPYRSNLVPGMKKVIAAARLAGARGVSLSGAGPTLVALTDDNYQHIARVMKDTFKQNGVISKTMILDPSPVGARALEIK